MEKATLKMIAPGIQVRYGARRNTIRFFAFINGRRVTATCQLQAPFDLLVKNRKPTKILKDEYARWVSEQEELVSSGAVGLRTPSCGELIEAYRKIAIERSNNPNFGVPSKRAITTAVNNYKRCVATAGLTMDDPCTRLIDTTVIQRVFERCCERVKGISAWTTIVSVKSVTAHWTELKYEDMGYRVPKGVRLPDKPKCAEAKQYQKMTPDRREKIEAFYIKLANLKDKWMYLAASMMVELAMRPIDVGMLTARNFIDDPTDPNGYKHLRYQPQKTCKSSGRWVDWPIKPAHWEQIRAIAGERLDAGQTLLPCQRYTFTKLNQIMRVECDMEDEAKACYELRKFCIDTVYRTLGPSAAVAISGDRVETVMKYYSDPYKIIVEKPVEVMPLGNITAAPGAVAGGPQGD